VVELLALEAHYAAAYASESPAAVSDLLTRFLPAARSRISDVLRDCTTHSHLGTRTVDPAAVPALAAWWATSKAGDPPGLSGGL
jgi:hypothetical protein